MPFDYAQNMSKLAGKRSPAPLKHLNAAYLYIYGHM